MADPQQPIPIPIPNLTTSTPLPILNPIAPPHLATIIHPTDSLDSAPLKTIRRSFELLSISSFLATFSQTFGIKLFSIRKLEADLSGSQPDSYVPSIIQKLLVSLTGDRSINSTNWEARLRREHIRRDPSTNPLGSEPFKPKPKAPKRAVGYVYIPETIPFAELYQHHQQLPQQNVVDAKPADPAASSNTVGIPDHKSILGSISPNALVQQDHHDGLSPTVVGSIGTQVGGGELKEEVGHKLVQFTHSASPHSLPPASLDPEPVDHPVFSTAHPLDTPTTAKLEPPDPDQGTGESTSPCCSSLQHPVPWATLSSLTKLRVLHRLCEWHLSTPNDLDRFRRLLDAKAGESDSSEADWRHERCGLDGRGNQYWLCGNGIDATMWVQRKAPEPPRGAITLRIPARGKKKRGAAQKRKRGPGTEDAGCRTGARAKRPRLVGTRSSSRLKGHQETAKKAARSPTVIVIKKTAAWAAPPTRRPEPRPRASGGEVWEDVPAGWLDEVVAPPCRAGAPQTGCCPSPMSSELSEPSDEASDGGLVAVGAVGCLDGGDGREGAGTDTVDALERVECEPDEEISSPLREDNLDDDEPQIGHDDALDSVPANCSIGTVEPLLNGPATAADEATGSSGAVDGEWQAGADGSSNDGGQVNGNAPASPGGQAAAAAEADGEAGMERSGDSCTNRRSTAGTTPLNACAEEHAGAVNGDCSNEADVDRSVEMGGEMLGRPAAGSLGLVMDNGGGAVGGADGDAAIFGGRSPEVACVAPTPDVACPSLNGTSFSTTVPAPSDEPRPTVEPKNENEEAEVEQTKNQKTCLDPDCPELKGHPLDPEWIEWEVVCSNMQEWERFCLQFESSEQKDEVALMEFVKTEALPVISEAFKAEEARVRMEEAMAQRKRSSRLATREVVQQTALEAVTGERESRMHSERLEAKRRRELEAEEAGRRKEEDLRLVRLREREERLVLREAQLAGEREAELKRAERARLRAESKVLGKAVKVAKSGAENSVVTVADPAERWELNCEICGVVGVNMDDGSEVICCDKCEQWQHLACHDSADEILRRPKRDWATADFTCAACSGLAVPRAVQKLRTHVNGKPKPKAKPRVRARGSKAQVAPAEPAAAGGPAKPRLMILMSHPSKDGGSVLRKVSPERCQPSQVAPTTDTGSEVRAKAEPQMSAAVAPGATASGAKSSGTIDLRCYYDDLEKLCGVLRANVNLHRSLPSEVVHRLRRYLVEQQQLRTTKKEPPAANVDPTLARAQTVTGASGEEVGAGAGKKAGIAPIGAPLATPTGWYDPAVTDPMPRLQSSGESVGVESGGGGCLDGGDRGNGNLVHEKEQEKVKDD